MRTSLSCWPENQANRRIPRLALAAATVLTAPAFLLGPSAAGAIETTPTAVTARSSTATATAAIAADSPASAPTAAATTTAFSPATPARAAAATVTPTPSGTTAGLTRTRSATITPIRPATRPTCGGKLTFGKVVVCPSIVDQQEHKWTVSTTADQDLLVTQLGRGSGEHTVGARVTNAAGQSICTFQTGSSTCQLGAAGTYTVRVKLPYPTGRGDYTIAVESTRTPSECTTLPESFFSFSSPGVTRTLPAGAAAQCYTFDQPSGSVLQVAEPFGPGDIWGQILGAGFEPLCEIRNGSMCTLTRPGPYRLLVREFYGTESTYTLKMPRLSDPVGCPTVPVAPFGDPGAAVGSGTMPAEDVACHTFVADAAGSVLVRFERSNDQDVWWWLYDTTGREVCTKGDNEWHCPLPAAGTYTLMLHNRNINPTEMSYQVAVTRLDRNDGCAAAAGTSWEQPTLRLHQTSPVQTNCQPFRAEAGDRVTTYVSPDRYNEDFAWLVDQSGARLCIEPSEEDGCVLPASGTYRVMSYLWNWGADSTDLTYQVQIRRLSEAIGCPTVTVGSYGTAPATGPIRCRSLEVAEAGEYRITTVSASNDRSYARVYDREGRKVCATGYCAFAGPGRYTLVFDADIVVDNDREHAVALLPWVPSGCATVSDSGWRDAPHRGAFQGAGQVNCLQLASPAGSRIVQAEPGEVTRETRPEISVVDAAGAYLCDYYSLRQNSCKLDGKAPFFAVLNGPAGNAAGAYAMAFARVDGPPPCPVLPRDAAGATATTGTDRFAVCFSVPADEHAARENFTWTRTSGSGDARMSVFDANGSPYCGPTPYAVDRTITCSLPTGPVTVLLEADSVDATYRITHRDASTPTS
ncbi:hypothetical protein AB0I37_00175 [Micromonospora purpureochromogenes]|uniref:hypothetical protein n=1 Tax=Micromonospora purpureochromogenes TaxID=47872 RepID=UPI0033D1B628